MLIFISYMIKVSISLALFYVLYKLLLSNDANHKYKRLTLLISISAAFAMPLLAHLIPANEISSTPMLKVRELIEMPLQETPKFNSDQTQTILEESSSIELNWTSLIYWGILCLLCIRFVISYQSIVKWLRKATIKPYKDILLAIVNDTIQAFSFSRYIVLSKQDYEQNKTPILLHEEAHIRLYHSFDVVLIELVCYLQWFNPFAWLLKGELKLVHEYQADQAVLNKGIDATQYQLLILEKAVGKRRFAAANHFKQGSISKRLKMMKKKQQKRWGVAKGLLFIPLGLMLLQAFTSPEIIKRVNTLPPLIVQVDSSQAWLSHWTTNNLPKTNGKIVTKRANMAEKGTESTPTHIKNRNVLRIFLNRRGYFMINEELVKKEEVLAIAKCFIQGKNYWGKTGPEVIKTSLPNGDRTPINKGVVNFIYDRGTNKTTVDFTMKALGKAYLEVRKEKAKELFNKDYFELSSSQRFGIDWAVPIRVVGQSERKSTANTLKLKITTEGIFFKDKICPLDQLADRIKPLMQKNPNATLQMIVKGELEMGIVDDVKKQLRLAGVSKLKYSSVN